MGWLVVRTGLRGGIRWMGRRCRGRGRCGLRWGRGLEWRRRAGADTAGPKDLRTPIRSISRPGSHLCATLLATAVSSQKSVRVTLTKTQLETEEGAELAAVCERLVHDGLLTNAEIGQLETWLLQHRDSELPAVTFLREIIAESVEDDIITDGERSALQRAIERVLPAEKRAQAAKARKIAKGRVEHFYSKVRGLTFPNADGSDRSQIISRLRPGDMLRLEREPDNPRESSAIKILTENGEQIGYIATLIATSGGTDRGLAAEMDRGIRVECRVKDLTGGGKKNRGVNLEIAFWKGLPEGQPSGSLLPPFELDEDGNRGKTPGTGCLPGCGLIVVLAIVAMLVVVAMG